MSEVGRNVRITGGVQGVFFRVWTQEQARELGVRGWIRNRPDGSVEAHLSGEEQTVVQMIELMRRGPANARVEDLTIEAAQPEKSGRFEVRH